MYQCLVKGVVKASSLPGSKTGAAGDGGVEMTQPAVGRARIPGNCLPLTKCAPHAAFGPGFVQGKTSS